MTTVTTDPAIVRDAKALGLQALTAIRTATHVGLGKLETEVPKLEGDSAAWAATWIDGHIATPTTRAYLKGAVGIAQTTFGESLDRMTVAGLVDLDHVIDTRIAAFETTLGATDTTT